ncbi:MAG: ABC transporter substrate-binding protein [Actinomycetota bacterium]
MRRLRSCVLGASLVALSVMLGACGGSGGDGETGGKEKGELTVGVSAAFTENQLVAEMYAQVLEDAGYTVQRQTDLGARDISDPALAEGEIDVKPEYLASELLFHDPDAEASGDPEENAQALAPLLEEKGIALLEYSEATDQNVFVVTSETATEHELTTVSDLQPVAGDLTLGGPPECPKRPFCLIGLKQTYGVEFGDFKALDVGGPATVAALEEGAVDVALLFSTNPVIPEKGWVVLEDDKGLQAAENIVPVVNADVLDDEIEELLNGVSAALTTDELTELIARVDVEREDVETVAEEFLTDKGLL